MAYTTKSTTRGSRNGRAVDGFALVMARPNEMGGNREGHNPEQRVTLTVV
jgi:organic hydroperoxide reductase OsmC/OhrA